MRLPIARRPGCTRWGLSRVGCGDLEGRQYPRRSVGGGWARWQCLTWFPPHDPAIGSVRRCATWAGTVLTTSWRLSPRSTGRPLSHLVTVRRGTRRCPSGVRPRHGERGQVRIVSSRPRTATGPRDTADCENADSSQDQELHGRTAATANELSCKQRRDESAVSWFGLARQILVPPVAPIRGGLLAGADPGAGEVMLDQFPLEPAVAAGGTSLGALLLDAAPLCQ